MHRCSYMAVCFLTFRSIDLSKYLANMQATRYNRHQTDWRGINSLKFRRFKFDLVLCSKSVITFVICNFLTILSIVTASIICINMISLCKTFIMLCAKQDRLRHLFFNRIVSAWNCLSNDVVSALSLLFKLRLHYVMLPLLYFNV